MTKSKVNNLLSAVYTSLEELEIRLKALDRVSEGLLNDQGFQEIESSLQDIKQWVYQRHKYLSDEREQLVDAAISTELQIFYKKAQNSWLRNFIPVVHDNIKKFFQWL